MTKSRSVFYDYDAVSEDFMIPAMTGLSKLVLGKSESSEVKRPIKGRRSNRRTRKLR